MVVRNGHQASDHVDGPPTTREKLRYNQRMVLINKSTEEAAPGAPSPASAGLIERIRAQDQYAWQRLLELHGPLVYGWCRRWGLQPRDAEEVVQEAFRAVAHGLEAFHKNRVDGSFRGWLWTIARNEANRYLVRENRCPEVIGGTDLQTWLAGIPQRYPENPDCPEVSAETVGLLRRAIELIRTDFQERAWRAFSLTVLYGHRTVDVANELGMTNRAVRQAKHRVLRRLREEFHDLIE